MKKSPVETYPLKQLTLEQAIQMQFKLVDIIRRHFNGKEILHAGDYGRRNTDEVVEGVHVTRPPDYTLKAEKVITELLEAKETTFTRGAGTGAIRLMFMGALKPGDQVVVDDTIMYPTTKVTMRWMGLDIIPVNMDNLDDLKKTINEKTKAVCVVHLTIFKKYRLRDIISAIKSTKYNPLVMVDDNYAMGRVEKIGVQLGADLSTFSLEKLLGPKGLGCVVAGTERGVEVIKQIHRCERSSGGSTVEGPEATEVLKSLVYVPVMLAIQKNVVDEIVRRLNKGEVAGVEWAVVLPDFLRTTLIKLEEPIAEKVYEVAWKYGSYNAAISSEGRHEIVGRISAGRSCMPVQEKFMPDIPDNYFLRMRPYRAGPDTMIDILRKSIEEVVSI